jgi:hypothetical protein
MTIPVAKGFVNVLERGDETLTAKRTDDQACRSPLLWQYSAHDRRQLVGRASTSDNGGRTFGTLLSNMEKFRKIQKSVILWRTKTALKQHVLLKGIARRKTKMSSERVHVN